MPPDSIEAEMEFIANALVILHLFYLLQHHQMLVEMKTRKDVPEVTFYRTTDYGRVFFLAIPRLKLKSNKVYVAEMCFTTLQYEATVSVIIPGDLYDPHVNWTERVVHIIHDTPNCMGVLKRYTSSKYGTGNAMKIVSSADISIIVTIDPGEGGTDMVILPPVTSYATTYYLGDIPANGYVLIIAAHDHTIVKYLAPKHFDLASPCAWNASCGVNSDGTFVLNTMTYTHFSFSYSDGSTTLTGTKITSSRPVLVLSGSYLFTSMETTILESSFSTRFVIPLFGRDDKSPSFQHDRVYYTFYSPIHDNFNLTINSKFKKLARSAKGQHEIKVELKAMRSYVIVYASRPVSVCMNYEVNNKKRSLLTLVPEHNWPNYISFTKPMLIDTKLQFKLHVVVNKQSTDDILMNGSPTKWHWEAADDYKTTFFELKMDSVLIMQRDSRKSLWVMITGKLTRTFGASLARNYNFPGKAWRYKCVVHNETVRPGDSIDNDCDGLIDEELWNGEDDDGDLRTDEDLLEERLNGQWGSWRQWHFDDTCRSGIRYRMRRQRFRACDLPSPANGGMACQGRHIQNSSEDCLSRCEEQDNPTICPLGKYGKDCTLTCPVGCAMNACEAERGTCMWQRCKPGYETTKYCNFVDYAAIEYIDPRLAPKQRNNTPNKIVKEEGGRLTILQLIAAPLLVLFFINTCIWANEKFNSKFNTQAKDIVCQDNNVSDAEDSRLRTGHKSILKTGKSSVDEDGTGTPKTVVIDKDIILDVNSQKGKRQSYAVPLFTVDT